MNLDFTRFRQHLKDLDFKTLFIEELGWDHHTQSLDVTVDGQTHTLHAVAQKRGMVVFVGQTNSLPYATRRKIERQVAKSVHEHLIIYTDAAQTTQIWQWVKREQGKPTACREHTYHRNQPGDALLQKLQALAFSLAEEEDVTIIDVTRRARAAFDVERVTKKFYDRFKAEHAAFLKFIKGIPDEETERWYASVMLNRLMFVYFVQKKGFLANDTNYLKTRLTRSRRERGNNFYRGFLCPLFFEGFAKKEADRSDAANRLLGKVPYLNGGIFLPHPIEERHGDAIGIEDKAFEKLFDFFDQYHWHLDERPLRADNEINPDVLGYIFEKYINQKQMGAYYTKEDITEYISKNTVIPFLFDCAREKCKVAFVGVDANQPGRGTNPPAPTIWQLLQADPDRYIYEPVRRGVIDANGEVIPESALPDFVQTGMHDPKARMFDKRYNLGEANLRDSEGSKLTLPTETWREYVERRKRCLDLRSAIRNPKSEMTVNDLITLNLDIRQFAQDVIENCEGSDLLSAFWQAIQQVTVLDPTCGSGAFLFAALNILEPLYQACLDRMEAFLEEWGDKGKKLHPNYHKAFTATLARMAEHPNPRYFILKSIIVNNLYGVDIMEEAVEICKLRLFLKLVAQIERVEDIEPLPDIDFNIRAGNTLVGYATYDDVKRAVGSRLDFDDAMPRIEEKAQDVDRLFTLFRQQQTALGGEVTPADKQALRDKLKELEDELNRYLATECGVELPSPSSSKRKSSSFSLHPSAFAKWLHSHKPFHWFIEFHAIMQSGGFDVIIGNPPYVELTAVTDYTTRSYGCQTCGNLYALMLERASILVGRSGRQGFIVPVSSVSADRYSALQSMIKSRQLHYSSYDDRPSRLFEGLEHIRLTIHIIGPSAAQRCQFATRYNKWSADERSHLFSTISHASVAVPGGQNWLPKVGTNMGVSILCKLFNKRTPLGTYSQHGGRGVMFYSRKIGYFPYVLGFEPRVLDGRGKRRPPSEFKAVQFPDPMRAATALAACNSNLFYWFVTVTSDCRHINKREIDCFPIDLGELVQACDGKALVELSASLMADYRKNSEHRKMRSQGDILTVQCIIPKRSKDILDQIDCVLARHYGFTDEELDFIINYDIKYRMGREAGDAE